ncbi:hypothetical protein EHF33_20725 (plasmid) [Deinococcus psychrotolerans]|uniref:Addiction module toxin RelE n=1 Tax=Deinococcus psychrotolerans TaxID=2489213 RepID=A0A3G8YMB2_9DEIO|nr:hypothetical protein [Deinococcus psychrotolerans]AZI45337.1 hypothetical protein EHF33_20725 [Deinococcus psychrotolerans]
MPDLVYTRHPERLQKRHTRIIETLIAMNSAGYKDCVTECIRMCKDLRANGRQSQFVKPLKYFPGAWELKPNIRGGLKGGARVYFIWLSDGRPLLVSAEYKQNGADADDDLLDELVEIAEAVKKGVLTP